jgi:hypothetical protein
VSTDREGREGRRRERGWMGVRVTLNPECLSCLPYHCVTLSPVLLFQYRVHEDEPAIRTMAGIGTGVRAGVGAGTRAESVSSVSIPYRDDTAARRESEKARREEAARVAMEGLTAEMIFTQGEGEGGSLQYRCLHRGDEEEKEEGARRVVCQTVRSLDSIREEPEPRFLDEEGEETGRNKGKEENERIRGEGNEEDGVRGDGNILGCGCVPDRENKGERGGKRIGISIGTGTGTGGMYGGEEEIAQREGGGEQEGPGGGQGGGQGGEQGGEQGGQGGGQGQGRQGQGGDTVGESISACIAEGLLGGHRASRLKKVTVSQIEIDTHVSHILNFSFPRSSFGSDLWRENR